ncbi:hypothetical protein ASG35_13050 [Burkholderia sp. Leaf177]|uniref:DUF3830 family protein n=1 Tax=Burkholderia sp. Leaf177 TaxID=1736287 RepID=UPI0006F752D7|nr:DUF3830 family protein [Burkholderia sp. Leaf177]KQR77177.1 hypothetical protein ASG35_13050 [Burkholderia sp. Leaf177]
MSSKSVVVSESGSGLAIRFGLLEQAAPEGTSFLWDLLAQPREMPAIHAMWTGPEISCPIPSAMIGAERNSRPLAPENATVTPQAGDLVLAYVPAKMWGGNPNPVFDLGFFYAPGGRMLFPIGWLAGSVIARADPADVPELARACGAIRKSGACTLRLARGE